MGGSLLFIGKFVRQVFQFTDDWVAVALMAIAFTIGMLNMNTKKLNECMFVGN